MNEEIKAALRHIRDRHAAGNYGFIYDGEIYLFCHPVKTLTLSMGRMLRTAGVSFVSGEFAIEPSTKVAQLLHRKYRKRNVSFDTSDYISGYEVMRIVDPEDNSKVITLLKSLLRDYASKPTPTVKRLL